MTTLVEAPSDRPESQPGRRHPGRLAAIGIAVAVLALAGWWLWGRAAPRFYHGTVLQGSDPAPSVAGLVTTDGDPLAYADGEITLVYFGYVFCPDVCPVSLDLVARAEALLDPADAERVRVVMISIDPERDTPPILDDYLAVFDPSFEGARGELDDTLAVASRYGVHVQRTGADGLPDPEGETYDHTTTLMGVDGGGSLRIVWGPGLTAEDLAADLELLLEL